MLVNLTYQVEVKYMIYEQEYMENNCLVVLGKRQQHKNITPPPPLSSSTQGNGTSKLFLLHWRNIFISHDCL